MLAAEDLGGVLLNAQHNFAWLTGGASNGIDLSRENGASFIFVRADGKRFLIANNIEMPRLLAEEVSEAEFEPVELKWQDERASANAVVEKIRSLGHHGDIGFDLYTFSPLRPIEALIAACRHELTSEEIGRYRDLGHDAGRAVGNVITQITQGETENEIARKLRDEFEVYGIYSVVTLVGVDERIERYRHPVPTKNIWNNSLLIAVCARRHGLIASLSRIVCAGDVSSELRSRTEAAGKVNAALCGATQPCAKAADLYLIAAEAYADLGFPGEIDKHHQGGACGYRTRDWTAHPNSSETVRLNQAFAWNPSITGTKAEETGIITPDGFEVITTTPGFPQVSTVVDGREYFSPGVLSLSIGVSA